MSLRAELEAGLARLGLSLDAPRVEALLAYLDLMAKWNRAYNLTAITDPQRMLSHHLLDSLAVLPHIDAGRLLDVGSGAGLPGIPLALARPELKVTLLEASQKKAAFLQQAVIELKLSNVVAVHARAEDYRPRSPFPRIISRAFSELADFVRLTTHLLADGGRWLAMKGHYPQAEIGRLEGARVIEVMHLLVPGLDAERHLVILGRA
ncbi:MAG: 16S rRNA (guanine(527)-N(7))-methyltransferase RsmG [Thiobacillaceae bacterium]